MPAHLRSQGHRLQRRPLRTELGCYRCRCGSRQASHEGPRHGSARNDRAGDGVSGRHAPGPTARSAERRVARAAALASRSGSNAASLGTATTAQQTTNSGSDPAAATRRSRPGDQRRAHPEFSPVRRQGSPCRPDRLSARETAAVKPVRHSARNRGRQGFTDDVSRANPGVARPAAGSLACLLCCTCRRDRLQPTRGPPERDIFALLRRVPVLWDTLPHLVGRPPHHLALAPPAFLPISSPDFASPPKQPRINFHTLHPFHPPLCRSALVSL